MPEDVIAPEIGLSPQTLTNMRSRRVGPPYVRLSVQPGGKGGRILYSRAAVRAWIAERTVTPGAAAS